MMEHSDSQLSEYMTAQRGGHSEDPALELSLYH